MDAVEPSLKIFKIISDETRLKILMILRNSEFTVTELINILEIHQSNISRHLTQLREGRLVQDRRDGVLIYYRWSEELRANEQLCEILSSSWSNIPQYQEIKNKISIALNERRSRTKDFFESIAGKYQKIAEPAGGLEGLVHAFASLIRFEHVVDIGAGEGEISLLLSRGSAKVTAVDLNQKMLNIIHEKCKEFNIPNVETKIGDVENLPLEDQDCDLVFMSQVLHHAPTPEAAIKEMDRVLQPGGHYIIIDLFSHTQEWMREKMGDTWLGFEMDRILSWLDSLRLQVDYKEQIHINNGLPLLFIKGHKPNN